MSFSRKILFWYSQNKRTLPWRRTRDPYKIWLSEIMLQQTRVAQGTPYYLKFIQHFPTVSDLAKASEEEVLKLWQGLGYYSRARNLHASAKMVVNEYNGYFPNTYKELLKLKGVGDYTASAIASICFEEPQAVVDGNVYRVLARYFGIDIPINSAEGIKYFRKLAHGIMDAKNIRDYNQGLMEFGAMLCSPKKPECPKCPLNDGCKALQAKKVDMLPVKKNRTKVRNRYFNYLVPLLSDSGINKTILKQRKGKGIWQHLWEFPLLESDSEISVKSVKSRVNGILAINNVKAVYAYSDSPIIHKLSHQHLHTRFWIVETNELAGKGIALSELEKYPVPVLIADFIETFKISYFCTLK